MYDEEEIQEIIDTFLSHLDKNNNNIIEHPEDEHPEDEHQEDEHVLLNMFIRHPKFQDHFKITGNNLEISKFMFRSRMSYGTKKYNYKINPTKFSLKVKDEIYHIWNDHNGKCFFPQLEDHIVHHPKWQFLRE